MKFIVIGLALILTIVGCKSALYKESVQDARDSAIASLRAFATTPVDDAGKGEGARALNKLAYCAAAQVLINEKQALPDGGLPCPKATP